MLGRRALLLWLVGSWEGVVVAQVALGVSAGRDGWWGAAKLLAVAVGWMVWLVFKLAGRGG